MKNKSNKDQNIISAIKTVEKSLRNELQKGLKRTEISLIFRFEEKIEKTEERLKEEIRVARDDLMNKIDSFAGRTMTLEEENTVGVHQTRELRVQVDNHETRITKIETTANI